MLGHPDDIPFFKEELEFTTRFLAQLTILDLRIQNLDNCLLISFPDLAKARLKEFLEV